MGSHDGEGYDMVGDVHGHADKLVGLLRAMGYTERDGVWRHPVRQVVFVGDLVDRGPRQVETVRIARAMVEAGTARIVVGNHEFNAIAFHTPDPDRPGEFLRPHSERHLSQHAAFIEQVKSGTSEHDELIAWFMTLPMWLDLGEIRVVHACWDRRSMEIVGPLVSATNSLTTELVLAACRRPSPEWQAVEHLLKGPEIPVGVAYRDKSGHVRSNARLRWWDPTADRLRAAVVMPEETTTLEGDPYPELPDTPISPPVAAYTDDVPVFFGHYWRTGKPAVQADHVACVDYSAGLGGPLVAYRWSGESTLTDANFIATAQTA